MNKAFKRVMPQCETPVALFIFNRPQLTRRVLNAIARAKPARLLVVADGPRIDQPHDVQLCHEARALIDRVEWPCEIQTNYSDQNLGCKHRVTSGLNWVFSQVEEAIILEDDCLPDATFFQFCSELLARYRNDERVYMVRGCNVLHERRFGPDSYYFSRLFNIWGWATWARAWQHYDIEMRRWPALRDNGWLEQLLPTPALAQMVRHIFDETHVGRAAGWDFQWQFTCWLRNAMAISPSRNLVANIGFGEGATHMHDRSHPHSELPTSPMNFPLHHPLEVKVLEKADQYEWGNAFPETRLWRRLLRRGRRYISSRTGDSA